MAKDKQILQAIKQEFEQDEKILEGAFRLERLVRKYKYWVLFAAAAVLAWGVYSFIYNAMQEKKAEQTSALYAELSQNPDNELLQQKLKEQARDLYDMFMLSHNATNTALLQELADSQNPLVKEIASYELASATKQNLTEVSGVLGEFAAIQQAFVLFQSKQIPQARKILESIKPESTLYALAKQMKHYGIAEYPLDQPAKLKEVDSKRVGIESKKTELTEVGPKEIATQETSQKAQPDKP